MAISFDATPEDRAKVSARLRPLEYTVELQDKGLVRITRYDNHGGLWDGGVWAAVYRGEYYASRYNGDEFGWNYKYMAGFATAEDAVYGAIAATANEEKKAQQAQEANAE